MLAASPPRLIAWLVGWLQGAGGIPAAKGVAAAGAAALISASLATSPATKETFDAGASAMAAGAVTATGHQAADRSDPDAHRRTSGARNARPKHRTKSRRLAQGDTRQPEHAAPETGASDSSSPSEPGGSESKTVSTRGDTAGGSDGGGRSDSSSGGTGSGGGGSGGTDSGSNFVTLPAVGSRSEERRVGKECRL